jgi:hypothetical protein
MDLEFTAKPIKPHNYEWCQGHPINTTCQQYFRDYFSVKGRDRITLRNLPKSRLGDVYVRYWSALPDTKWKNVDKAYQIKTLLETEPDKDYPNGGVVKVDRFGKARFTLNIGPGYVNGGEYMPPHFHYRICHKLKISPVATIYIDNYTRNTNFLVENQAQKYRSLNTRLFDMNMNVPNIFGHNHHHHKYSKHLHHKYPLANLPPSQTFWGGGSDYEQLPGPISGAIMGGRPPMQFIGGA